MPPPRTSRRPGRSARDTFKPDEIVPTPAIASSARCRAGWRRWSRQAVSQWGQPNGYVLGEEGGGAFVAGLRYGEGTLYTKNAGDLRVYWQGPSIGFDAGGEGARTMMLVYNLPATDAIYQRFAGIDGSAYFIGGFGMTALDRQQHRAGADPLRRRAAARRQYRLSQVHAEGDLEPVLRRRHASAIEHRHWRPGRRPRV